MKNFEILLKKELFLLDMDGTIYHDDVLIDGALDFINLLVKRNLKYLFMTNNSSKSSDDYLIKLNKLKVPAEPHNIFTSGQASALYLNNIKKNARLYVVGTSSLKNELKKYGFDICEEIDNNIDFLLVGYDTELTYKKLTDACELLCNDIPFYATNPDVVCPAKNGRYLPDCQTMCNMLTQATGKEPFYIGKPRKEMALTAVDFKKSTVNKSVLIGDRLYTDIACGKNADITSILVLSGESQINDIKKYNIEPDIIINNIKDIYDYLSKT